MADLKCTISDTSSQSEEIPSKKRDLKAKRKNKDDEGEVIEMDAKFSLIDDTLKKDVSKILKR